MKIKLAYIKFDKEYFIFLLPLFFIIHRYIEHFGSIPTDQALLLLAEYIGIILFLSLFFSFFFQSFRKASLFTFSIFTFHLFFGNLHDVLKENFEESFIAKYTFILPAVAISFALVLLYLKRSKRRFAKLTQYLNALLLIFILIEGIQLTIKVAENKPTSSKNEDKFEKKLTKDSSFNPADKEDIHLIIADGYAGRTELKEALNYNNSDFEAALRKRGFHIIENSISNYNYTVISMASLFQMNYIADTGKNADEWFDIGSSIINDNPFIHFLRGQGYEIKNFSIFNFAGQPSFLKPFFSQGIRLITSNTFISRIKNDIWYHVLLTFRLQPEVAKATRQMKYNASKDLKRMDSVVKVIARRQRRQPGFYYTHLMMPHPPYYFDRDSNFVGMKALLDKEIKRTEKDYYINYLQYCNKKFISFIDNIIKVSAKPPIIIFMSDHGFRHADIAPKYHFMNINAVLYPGRKAIGLYPGMSNVNQLRILLNTRFNQNMPLLKDSTILIE